MYFKIITMLLTDSNNLQSLTTVVLLNFLSIQTLNNVMLTIRRVSGQCIITDDGVKCVA